MTEIEVAEKIVENEDCFDVCCIECPANIRGEPKCKCGGLAGSAKTESQLQWFKDFLKGAKQINGIDKAEAKKRLDAIEEEAGKLREIIEKGDRIEYNNNNIYVGVQKWGAYAGAPYILVGYGNVSYYRWHAFVDMRSVTGWSGPSKSGQEAIDSAIKDGFDIHVFTDTRKAFEFFLEHYKG